MWPSRSGTREMQGILQTHELRTTQLVRIGIRAYDIGSTFCLRRQPCHPRWQEHPSSSDPNNSKHVDANQQIVLRSRHKHGFGAGFGFVDSLQTLAVSQRTSERCRWEWCDSDPKDRRAKTVSDNSDEEGARVQIPLWHYWDFGGSSAIFYILRVVSVGFLKFCPLLLTNPSTDSSRLRVFYSRHLNSVRWLSMRLIASKLLSCNGIRLETRGVRLESLGPQVATRSQVETIPIVGTDRRRNWLGGITVGLRPNFTAPRAVISVYSPIGGSPQNLTRPFLVRDPKIAKNAKFLEPENSVWLPEIVGILEWIPHGSISAITYYWLGLHFFLADEGMTKTRRLVPVNAKTCCWRKRNFTH